jgi:hypothetical protein
MRTFFLDIIVIDLCSSGGFPLEEESENFPQYSRCSFWCYSGIILVLVWCCSSYIVVHLPFLSIYFCSAYFLYLEYYKWYQRTFLDNKLGFNFFFRVDTYSDVFKIQRSVVTHINPQSGIHTHMKYKWYLSTHLLATLVTPVGTPLSGIALYNTCIQIDLDLLNPSIDKPIGLLTTIVELRTTLGKIPSSTWVVE